MRPSRGIFRRHIPRARDLLGYTLDIPPGGMVGWRSGILRAAKSVRERRGSTLGPVDRSAVRCPRSNTMGQGGHELVGLVWILRLFWFCGCVGSAFGDLRNPSRSRNSESIFGTNPVPARLTKIESNLCLKRRSTFAFVRRSIE